MSEDRIKYLSLKSQLEDIQNQLKKTNKLPFGVDSNSSQESVSTAINSKSLPVTSNSKSSSKPRHIPLCNFLLLKLKSFSDSKRFSFQV